MMRSQDALTGATCSIGRGRLGAIAVFAFEVVVAQPLRPKPTAATPLVEMNDRLFT